MTAVDVSEFAVECARRNAERNGLGDVMECVAANVFDLLPALAQQPTLEVQLEAPEEVREVLERHVRLLRSEAVVLAAMLGFVVYLVVLLWAFAERSLARLAAVVLAGAAAAHGLAYGLA